jgi:unsaturated chondroitin disaccharide hydrolase
MENLKGQWVIFFAGIFIVWLVSGCASELIENESLDIDNSLVYCTAKLSNTCKNFEDQHELPRVIHQNEQHWSGSSINSWTSGFYPGLLWLMYNYTGEEQWKQNATYYTELLEPIKRLPWKTHDFGFMMYYSYGLGYDLTQNKKYRAILLETADSLARLYNPAVGAMESWPWMKRKRGWPHTTIIDNMMNLELLFWAAENGGNPNYVNMAIHHARKTQEDFIRPDHSTFHIVVYDSVSPNIIRKETDQGVSAETTWARGHSWATYGFIKAYKYCNEQDFLMTAMDLANYYIQNCPEDLIPYWDFDAPLIPNEPRDASAAAIMASAMLEISSLSNDDEVKQKYYLTALQILSTLSSEEYLSTENDAFLTHSISSKPANSGVNVSLIYTDYYYLEALLKAKQMAAEATFANVH